jgi:hypothetical protein
MKLCLTNRRALGLLLGASLLLSASAWAQGDNGIVVGKPKVFDNRSLYIMLDELKSQLRNIQTVDPQKLAQSLGLLQGYQSHDVSVAVDLTSPAAPKVTTTEKVDSTGKLVPSDRTTEQAASTPTPPGLPELPAAPAFTPSFGENSQDLLADQVSLSYQIFNIRMLLERSLSDRLLEKDPRLQALLGFSISLDPAKSMRDRAAYVEIRVTPLDGTRSAEASLVSLMPLEKTYNAAALDTKASAFGGSAVAKVITLGVNARSRSQNFYLFRDADTIALERLPATAANSSSVSFGWEFRPVLGRRSVSPGMRQMFAVLALPAADDISTPPQRLKVEVRTYWRRYHRRTLSTKPTIEYDSGWKLLGNALAYNSRQFEEDLTPKLEKIRCYPTGAESGICSITGRNLFPGTRVLIGNTVLDTTTKDLVIKSDNTMEVRVNLKDLATSDAVISGRYGKIPDYSPPNIASTGVLINYIQVRQEGDKTVLFIDLQEKTGNDLVLPAEEDAYVTVNGSFIPGPYDIQPLRCEARPEKAVMQPWPRRQCSRLTVAVPNSLMTGAARVSVRYPFRGASWNDAWTVSSPRKVTGIVNLGGDPDVTLAITGTFLKSATVTLDHDTKYPLKVNDEGTLATFKVKRKTLDNYSHVIVEVPNSDPVILDVPPAPSVKPAANTGKKGSTEDKKKKKGNKAS